MTRASVHSQSSGSADSALSNDVLDGFYALHDELGSGGFGKVKLATHLLTGQKVAIKIIDKRAIGEDLPRVTKELEALRKLSHQNICRLYQHIETEDKFYIVMEFCSGGEMFDYIVKKERLQESEARHFFRQLVQAIAYVHSMGFAHRDLKPENLLLTEDLQLKLIDFGLCAHPRMGLSRPLDTCCGSPAYAAPELIQGKAYLGHEADVWSMGVLLYALLCGTLPFEDDNMQILYRKITRGIYNEPGFLSQGSKELLRSMLQVNPKNRITVKQLIEHEWINMNYSHILKWQSIYDPKIVDADVTKEISIHFGKPYAEMEAILKEWRFDYITATYFLLLTMKRRGMKYALPMRKMAYESGVGKQNILTSPTIHASLGQDLDRSGLDDDGDVDENVFPKDNNLVEASKMKSSDDDLFLKPVMTHDGRDKMNASFVHAVYARPLQDFNLYCGGGDFQIPNYPGFATPVRKRGKPTIPSSIDVPTYGRCFDINKENFRPATVRVRGPFKVYDEGRPRSGIYATPARTAPQSAFVTPKPSRAHSSEQSTPPSTVGSCGERAPRSATKTPRLRQRVFASLERQADKMINLLTPRKLKSSSPGILKHTKTMVNVSITSSRNPDLVRRELIKAFADEHLSIEQRGWKITGRKRDDCGRSMTVELEIVLIEMGNQDRLVGVKRKRLSGDSFLYKKVCEQILRLAGL
uniref:non-specific serine/threonine protein kinase n=1 Tax=Syphacia muris TaxID=451379 RepID=A0A0N5ALL1_9BILA